MTGGLLLKIKRRKKKLKIKVSPTLKIKRRRDGFFIQDPILPERDYYMARRSTLGIRPCSTPDCQQAVYGSETEYCYFCDKVKQGLMTTTRRY